jgi:hypothetical protein
MAHSPNRKGSLVRIIVAGEQISFFERFGYVELESFFGEKSCSSLLFAIEQEIEQRRKQNSTYSLEDPSLLYGYDLALSSKKVQKEVFSHQLAQAAFALIRKKPLRYAFDVLWNSHTVLARVAIDAISSISPVMLSVVIALEDQSSLESSPPVPFEYASFPKQRGSVAFVSPQTMFNIQKPLSGKYLILAYSSANAVYRLLPSDTHTHFLKNFGYVFGDQLKESTHPLLFR